MIAAAVTSSIVFFAAAVALALLFVLTFFLSAVRKKRRRNGFHVLLLVLGGILFPLLLAVSALSVIRYYQPFTLSVLAEGNTLALLKGGKRLFGIPYIAKALPVFEEMRRFGAFAPPVLALLCLLAEIALGVKTVRGKKRKIAPADTVAPVAAGGEITDEQMPIAPPQAEPQEEVLREDEPPMPLDEDTARTIVDEIDALVPGDRAADDDGINAQLQRAIAEGYALFENMPDEHVTEPDEQMPIAPPQSEEQEVFADEPPQSEEQRQEIFAENEPSQEQEQEEQEETYADEQPPQEQEEPAQIFADERPQEPKPPIREPVRRETKATEDRAQQTAAANTATRPVFDFGIPTRVRTIVRRPTAHNIDEIEKRAEQLRETAENKDKPVATAKKTDTAAKPATAAKKATATAAKKPTAKKTTTTKKASGATKTAAMETSATKAAPPKPDKTVEAQENKLPLTRKYIILNRRNAAAVFNDYLNSKREQEKAALTDSLNTIIMK